EDVGLPRAALVYGVNVAVFTVGVDHAVHVDDRRVDAPLEAHIRPLSAGGIRHARDRSIRVARADLVVGILKLPFDIQVGAELRDEERTVLSQWTDRIDVAVGTKLRAAAVLVVFD